VSKAALRTVCDRKRQPKHRETTSSSRVAELAGAAVAKEVFALLTLGIYRGGV